MKKEYMHKFYQILWAFNKLVRGTQEMSEDYQNTNIGMVAVRKTLR